MAALKKACFCGSGLSYGECCGPYHRREREAPDAETLMRSRFSAYALRDAEYLWDTLHPKHTDRIGKRDKFIQSMKATHFKYMGLVVYDYELVKDIGEAAQKPSKVLFLAKVFNQGRNISFVELSEFLHDGKGFRYVSGVTQNIRDRTPPKAMTIAEFFKVIL